MDPDRTQTEARLMLLETRYEAVRKGPSPVSVPLTPRECQARLDDLEKRLAARRRSTR